MLRVADVAIDGQRVVRRHVARPVESAHGVVQFVRRGHGRFEDRPQDADGGAQPEVGLVEQGQVAGEVDAAAARLHVGRAEAAQLVGQHRLDAAAQVAK